MSYRNFLTSLILSHREMLVKYKLIACLPKAFPVFSPFSFSSCWIYSVYFLLIVSSLALSTLSCVHLLPNKYPLPLSRTLFNSSRFLCCSIPSFVVSKISPRRSSSFYMSPAWVIAFIKGLNCHQMKNNIGYKGNTNNTSVIIFFKSKRQKLPAMVLCLGEPPRRIVVSSFFFFFDFHFVVVSSFHFCVFISFHFWSSFFCCFLRLPMFFNHICFSTSSLNLLFDIIPHPSVDYLRVFTPILYFQPSPSQSGSRHFHFQLFRDLLTASATVLSGRFLPTGVFYLSLFHRHFWLNLHLSRPPWEPVVLPWSLQGFILILETHTRLICLFDSQ